MNKLWDDLKKNMKDWGSIAAEKAEEVSKRAIAKTEELARISKIKLEINQLQRSLSKTYENLGKYVAVHAKEKQNIQIADNQEMLVFLKQIDETKKGISEKEMHIQKIKEEFERKVNENNDTDQDAASTSDINKSKSEGDPINNIFEGDSV